MNGKAFFSAIKSLKDIQNDYLAVPPLVSFKFTEKFQIWIKETLKNIEKSSFSAFLEWIAKVDQVYIEKFGVTALKLSGKRMEKSKGTSKLLQTSNINPLDWILEENEDVDSLDIEDEFELVSQQINLNILFECLYAHSLLDEKDSFLKNYTEMRNNSFQKILQAFRSNSAQSSTSNQSIIASFDSCLIQICGFFVFESLVLNNAHSSFSKSGVESKWITFWVYFMRNVKALSIQNYLWKTIHL